MYPQPRPKSTTNITTTWTNTPLHIKLGISKAEMNAHVALHARVHDYEEGEKERKLKPSPEADKQASLNTVIETRELAEVEGVEENGKQHLDGCDHDTKTALGGDNTAVISSSGEARVVITDESAKEMVAATTVQDAKANGDKGRENGGHTPGEVWTESPHFLWGP